MPLPEPTLPKSYADELTKVGALAVAFFLMQAAGYASVQPNTCITVSDKAFLVAVAGVAHLSHILMPFSGVAWPLGPTVCGLILLYIPYLPTVLRSKEDSPAIRKLNVYALSLSASVYSTSAFGAILLKLAPEVLQTWRSLPGVQYFEPILYLVTLIGLSTVYKKLIRTYVENPKPHISVYPLPELLTSLVAVCLLAAAYLGARFDGHMDRMHGICAVASVTPNPSVKLSTNGRPPGPSHRYGVHFLWLGPGVLPLAPAYLER